VGASKIVDYKIQSAEPVDIEYYTQLGRRGSFKIFLDTNVIIDIVLKNERYRASERLFKAFEQLFNEGIVEFATSSVCIVEAIYQLGDLNLFKLKGEELLQELAENINDAEALRTIIVNASRPQRWDIKNASLKHWKMLKCLLRKYITIIASPENPDMELIQLAYRGNIQTQDLLVFISALDGGCNMLLTNDKKFHERVEELGKTENYILTRSLVNYKAAKTTLKTLRDEGIILNFEIAKMEGRE